jgi:hypothetical protein
MEKFLFSITAITLFIATACNNSSDKTSKETDDQR